MRAGAPTHILSHAPAWMRTVCHVIWLTVFWLAVMASNGLACQGNTSAPVTVSDGIVAQIGCAIDVMRIPRSQPDLDTAIADFNEDRFQPLGLPEFSFGLESEAFWLTFELENANARDQDLIFDFGLPYITALHVWAVGRDGVAQKTLSDGAEHRFGDRVVKNRIIVSPPIAMAAGETTRIWAYAAFDGPASLPITVYPASMATEITLKRDFPLVIFVSVSATLFVVLAGLAIVLRSRTGLFYAGFFAGVLAYNAQLSGLLFAYIWPGWPQWNAVASHLIGLGAVAFALLFAREFTRSGQARPILVWTIRSLVAVSVAFIAAPLFWPLTSIKSLAGLIVLAFLCVQLWAAIVAMIDRVPGRGFYLIGTLVLFAYLGSFTVASQIESAFGPAASGVLLRLGQLLDGMIFCAAAFRQTWELRQREVASRLQGARIATELASTRHDLRQPLLSMRSTMDEILSKNTEGDEETRAKLAAGLAYIQGIVEDTSDFGSRKFTRVERVERPQADVPLQLLMENVALMFDREAIRKAVDIRVVETSVVVQANGLDLFRILSNLVSNAVQHSQSDRILVGVRRHKGDLALEVLDRGVGLTADRIEQRKTTNVGGLGLSIVRSLCEQNGWVLKAMNEGGPGTRIRVGGLKLASIQI